MTLKTRAKKREKTRNTERESLSFVDFFVRYGLLVATAALFIVFTVLEPKFVTPANIFTIIRQASILGMLALALTIVVILGEFDISLVGVSVFAGVVPIIMIMNGFQSVPLVWIVGVALGIGLSLVNASGVVYIGIPSFIITLGMMMTLTGASRGFTKGAETFPASLPPGFTILGKYSIGGLVPVMTIVFIVAAILVTLLLDYTPTGRYIYSVGGNPDASVHVGIRIRKIKIIGFLVAGILYGVAGITMSSMFGSANSSMGDGYLMPAIIACFLGGSFLTEGVPNPRGTIVSVILLAILANGFTMTNVPFYGKAIMQGIILLVALITLSVVRRRRLAR
jgi:ribose/xylose/arabinose/galactoside ABC-type transport system permease subunit